MIASEIHFAVIDSTNNYARENSGNLPLPSLIIADEQTAGRGRRGNSFYSPKDTGIYFTLLFEAEKDFNLITPAAAVCVCESIEKFTGITAGIKWVNDIFLSGKKIGGILCERFASSGKELTAAGIGINLTTEEFPPEIPGAGSLGAAVDKAALARDISERILSLNQNGGSAGIAGRYRERLFILGRKITYMKNGIPCEGYAEDINEECNLIVKMPGGTDILNSGEISVRL